MLWCIAGRQYLLTLKLTELVCGCRSFCCDTAIADYASLNPALVSTARQPQNLTSLSLPRTGLYGLLNQGDGALFFNQGG